MKKTFQIAIEGKNRDRLLDRVKHDIRKYQKRERGRAVPEGAHYWDFDCRLGVTEDVAASVPVAELIPAINALAQGGADSFYVEIMARAAQRKLRPEVAVDSAAAPAASQDG